MATGFKFSPYFIAAAFIVCLNFYYIYNLMTKNQDLKTKVNFYSDALSVTKEKHKVLDEAMHRQLSAKQSRIRELDGQVMSKHSTLGKLQETLAKLKREVSSKSSDIEKLQNVASNHKREIADLQTSLSKSNKSLKALSEQTKRLMSELLNEKEKVNMDIDKFQNEIKEHQDARGILAQQTHSYMRKNEQLSIQVANLTNINNLIRDNIKQKIKESYVPERSYNKQPLVGQDENRAPVAKVTPPISALPVDLLLKDTEARAQPPQRHNVGENMFENSDKPQI